MPIRLSDLSTNRRTVRLDVGDETVAVTYDSGRFTPELEDEIRELTADERNGAAIVALLSRCVLDWDILDDSGKPLKPTKDNLRRLPLAFLAKLASAIAEDVRPDPTKGGSSGGG